MKYNTIFLLDDNDTTNFYNKDIITEFEPCCDVLTFVLPSDFLKFYCKNTSFQNSKLLLLLDINMPEKQGFDVVEELEEDSDNLNDLDIILLSSSNLKVDVEKSTRFSNIIGFIEKPLTTEKLMDKFNSVKF
jgi:CheY-like chemotaxis protein